MKTLKNFFSSDWAVAIFLFLVAAGIRLVPEIKAGIWPIGYDTFNTYAAELSSYNGPLINFFKTANILYFFFLPFKALGVSPDLIVKIFGPFFYGGLIISFYFFARKFLNFSVLKAFLLVLLTTFQLAGLRLSWDLYRNELGLIFLFWGLIYLPGIARTKNLVLFVLFAALVTLSNELVAVLLLIILLVYAVYYLFQKKWEELISVATVLVICGIIFSIVISSSSQVLYSSQVFFTGEKNYFWRYFYRYNAEIPYDYLKQIIGQLFWLLYGWVIPFAVVGLWYLRKNLVLWVMLIWLLFGTFSSLIFLGNGLIVWERWLFMLVFPVVVYAAEGIFQLGRLIGRLGNFSKKLPYFAIGLATIFWIGYLGLFIWRSWGFLTANYSDAKPPLANEELNNYFPRTMVHNSIGMSELNDVLNIVQYLDKTAPPGSVILVDNRYRGMMVTHFSIDNRYIITNPWSETIESSTLEAAKKTNYWPIYLIWNTSKGIPGFDRIYSSGDRGVYQALPEFKNQ